MTLTLNQVQTIKATVPVLKEHGNAITTHFYKLLLTENPDLNNIFNVANQANKEQPAALAASLYAYASHIDDLGALSPAVEKICQKHASLYVQPEHYDVVGTYLLRAMGDILGSALTPEILEAWGQAYWQLANVMIKREDSLYKTASDWPSWRRFTVTKKVVESSEITSFYLTPEDGKPLPSFLPGQYISVQTSVPELGLLQSRQYSLSDAPGQSYYRISVKKEPGAQDGDVRHPAYISNILHEQKEEGDTLEVSHPFGDFFCDPKEDTEGPVVLLSAGVGITPMVSILNTLTGQNSKRNISFIHGTRSSETQAFGPHIQKITKQYPGVKAIVFNKLPSEAASRGTDYDFKSRMNLDALDKKEDLFIGETTTYYICGPGGFMKDMGAKLREFGVVEEKINMEIFGTGNFGQ